MDRTGGGVDPSVDAAPGADGGCWMLLGMPRDAKDAFAELYRNADRAGLARAGREHLDGNLKIRARRNTRRFWIVFGIAVVVAVAAAVWGVMALLDLTSDSASRFERGRSERMQRINAD